MSASELNLRRRSRHAYQSNYLTSGWDQQLRVKWTTYNHTILFLTSISVANMASKS